MSNYSSELSKGLGFDSEWNISETLPRKATARWMPISRNWVLNSGRERQTPEGWRHLRLVRTMLLMGWSAEVVVRMQERMVLFRYNLEVWFSSFICLGELRIYPHRPYFPHTTQHNTTQEFPWSTITRRAFLELLQATHPQVHTFVILDSVLIGRTPLKQYVTHLCPNPSLLLDWRHQHGFFSLVLTFFVKAGSLRNLIATPKKVGLLYKP